ncbi:cyclin-G1 [Octodon degus]|uniref:Cyclin-G1 n=1 Tax=Octodon degus TaxID=10160 RepID=A0A6P6EYY0_OCTDE|nr:cyclin-G1 [Octodon degus]
MIEVLTTTDSQKLLHQLNTLLEQEARCQPKVCGLRLIESAHDNGLRMTARLRDFEVKDLLSLTQFFGFDTETFSLAVNLLDRFLSKMKVQPKHLGCVGLSCFYLAVKSIEEERNIPLATDLIRISQYRFTVSDLMRMEKIVLEKVCWKIKATTAFQFLQLYYSLIQENLPFERKNSLNFERLEAQLKACHCRIIFSKAKTKPTKRLIDEMRMWQIQNGDDGKGELLTLVLFRNVLLTKEFAIHQLVIHIK